jgi:hypothetical protein
MSNILVVQPHKMLQQAFVIALSPEHHVLVLGKIPDAESAAGADLVIIDAGALRARNLLTGRELSALQSWLVPIIWLDTEALIGAATAKLVCLTPPVKREELRTAVAACLQVLSAPQPTGVPSVASAISEVATDAKATEPTPAAVGGDDEKEIIELVDVFDEVSSPDDGNVEARNKD